MVHCKKAFPPEGIEVKLTKREGTLLDKSCKSGWAFRVGPGSGLSLSKCFGIGNIFIMLRVTIFLSFMRYICLTNWEDSFCE